MIDGSQLATVPLSQQYTDYEVSEGDKDELDSLFEGDTNTDHFKFLRKVQARAQAEIQSEEDENIPEKPENYEKLREAENRAAEVFRASPISDLDQTFQMPKQVISADASDEPWKVVEKSESAVE